MLSYMQQVGKALMIPVAVLPAAAVLMGIGYWLDPVGWGIDNPTAAFFIKAGSSIIDSIGILFAVGVAYGTAKDKDGSAALSGLTAWLVTTTLLSPDSIAMISRIPLTEVSPAFVKIQNPFIGIVCGVVAASLYNRYSDINLPLALAFFSGRRFIPVATALAMMLFSGVLLIIWPLVYNNLVIFGIYISGLGPLGAALYGFFNRILIPFGMHHPLNAVFWFDVAGINDIGNFWSGKGTLGVTGMYQAGFFPIMMFGLVGAAFAFVRTAYPQNIHKVRSIMLSAAFASFFTGVTEPIEFAFMFSAPGLYILHALLTGLSMYLTASFQITAGFGFSAGFIDFLLSSQMPLANRPYMLLVLGVIFVSLYYFPFVYLIKRFNLKTPGREDVHQNTLSPQSITTYYNTAKLILQALGGAHNLKLLDNCATRLRIEIFDDKVVDQTTLRNHSLALIKLDEKNLQIVIGPKVELLCNEIKKLL